MEHAAPFPVDRCPARLRGIVLAEFAGRIPSLQEVKSIPDKEWLKRPGMGPKILGELRRLTGAQLDEVRSQPLSVVPVDELFSRLAKLQEEARAVTYEIWMRTRLSHAEDC